MLQVTMKTDFNDYKDTFDAEVQNSIGFMGQDADFYTRIKADLLVEIAGRYGVDAREARLLDVGCGNGRTDSLLAERFDHITGVDIAEDLVETARDVNPGVQYLCYDGHALPFADESFDLTFTICVMHHVDPADWGGFLREVRRVTRAGGLFAVFEHNPLNPLTRLAVKRCSFDRDAVLIPHARMHGMFCEAGLSIVEERHILCFPFPGSAFRAIERGISVIPLGAQYYVLGRR